MNAISITGVRNYEIKECKQILVKAESISIITSEVTDIIIKINKIYIYSVWGVCLLLLRRCKIDWYFGLNLTEA